MTEHTKANAMDHVVLVLFENRSLDNMLGHLYGPEDCKTFEGVIGKNLSNPVPEWAEHQPPDGSGRVVYGQTEDLDAPNPDSGEEYFHTNTQMFNTLDEHNKGKMGKAVAAPWNVPAPGAKPTMDGFVTDYISSFMAQVGRQPTFEEYSQIMTGYRPDQVPVLSGLARDFGVFDHWFSEVPSQTFMNRSFWTAATSSGFTINAPFSNFTHDNTAETLFDRLEAHGKTWKVYVMAPCPISFTGLIHMSRLKDKFSTNFAPFSQFEEDAKNGNLPDFSLIEPNLFAGHGDYHPAAGRNMVGNDIDLPLDPPSAISAGEGFLKKLFDTYRSMDSDTGANVFNTTLFIGWDEPGGTYDHVAPGAVPPPDPKAGPGQCDFTFDRSGYRVPAIVVSPWVESGSVFNDEHRHTSMIATLRKQWNLGDPLTGRDAVAKTLDYVFTLDTPRKPDEWAEIEALPVPEYHVDWAHTNQSLSTLGKAVTPSVISGLKEHGVNLPPEVDSPDFALTPQVVWTMVELLSWKLFPTLAPSDKTIEESQAAVEAALGMTTPTPAK
jgi:phospholipase C